MSNSDYMNESNRLLPRIMQNPKTDAAKGRSTGERRGGEGRREKRRERKRGEKKEGEKRGGERGRKPRGERQEIREAERMRRGGEREGGRREEGRRVWLQSSGGSGDPGVQGQGTESGWSLLPAGRAGAAGPTGLAALQGPSSSAACCIKALLAGKTASVPACRRPNLIMRLLLALLLLLSCGESWGPLCSEGGDSWGVLAGEDGACGRG